jgi:hypothetical protein
MNSDDYNASVQTNNIGQGYLVIHVTTARGAIPLEGARVSIRDYSPEGSLQRGDVIATLVSGSDGNTAIIPLTAPPRTQSQQPTATRPYATYNIEARLFGYEPAFYQNVPVFDGITAIQQVNLIPLPENGYPDGFTLNGGQQFEGADAQPFGG